MVTTEGVRPDARCRERRSGPRGKGMEWLDNGGKKNGSVELVGTGKGNFRHPAKLRNSGKKSCAYTVKSAVSKGRIFSSQQKRRER